MTKIILALVAICLVTTFAPSAEAQACEHFDPHGEAGVYEGKPSVHYVILDCQMTPIILHFNSNA